MGFQQGLSGLNVSAKALDAIGNNIANSSTVGYKSSQVQFADVYAASLGGGGAGQIGIGASAPSIAQLFTQGNITTTNNPLDMAINGGGFYRLSDGGTPVYSRNGQFSLDKDGYMVNTGGLRVTGYGADDTGAIVPGDFVDLRLSTTNIEPSSTTSSNVLVNLDSRSTAPAAMTSGTLTGSAAPVTLVITAANNTLTLSVDGAGPATIDVPIATYASRGDLAIALQTAINSNPTLAAADALVDVSVNTSGALAISSRSSGTLGSQGTGSTVTQAGGDGLVNLLGAPTPASGADNFSSTNTLSYTGSTAQTVYDTLGNPHNLTMYFAKTANQNTWQLYTALDGKYYEGYDQGTTGVTVINNGDTGIKFVKGDLTISSDIVVPENQFLMVIVKGTINIDIGASRVDGIYVADKAINVTGSSSNQLIINGVLYTPGLNSDIKLTRSFTDNSKNNTTPATLINYRPDMIFAIPGKLFRVLTGFREL
jgi:flagellar hook protein FlgE